MPDAHGRQHFGPNANLLGGGPETVHAIVYEAAVGKTVAEVYLGDDVPIAPDGVNDEPGIPASEYLVLKFTDGTFLGFQIGAGNSFHAITGESARKLSPNLKLHK